MTDPRGRQAKRGEGVLFAEEVRAARKNRELMTQLARWRHKRDSSQRETAKLMRTSQSAVARMESHQHDPQLSTLARYVTALGLSVHFVLTDIRTGEQVWTSLDAPELEPTEFDSSADESAAVGGDTVSAQSTDGDANGDALCLSVREELLFDPLVDPADIRIGNEQGKITLEGTVQSYPEYKRAADAARRVTGVTGVVNELEVKLPRGDHRGDEALANAANSALALDARVPRGVKASARNGIIKLTGTVSSGWESDAAATAVSRMIGVKDVKNNIKISGRPDPEEVVASVREALDRYSLNVDVDSEDGTVTLSGEVRNWAEHEAVLTAAKMANGGTAKVNDKLEIVGRRGPG
jgi:osmotically-inducible protein OsmY